MSILHTRRFSSWARGHLLCRTDDATDRFALTFDDGPNPRATGAILDVLARHGARGTFFMLGGNIGRYGISCGASPRRATSPRFTEGRTGPFRFCSPEESARR